MTKFFLFFFIILLFITESRSQVPSNDTIPLVNSGEVIRKGIALHDQKKYDQAIQKYLTVPESDTNYAWMCTELMNSYTKNESYTKAIELGKQLLKNKSAYRVNIYNSLGNAYDDHNQSDKSIATYQQGLQLFPYNYLLHYNMGVALFRKKELEKASQQFIQAITLNPYHANSHLYLADVMIMQGRTSRAMMCLATYLSLVPKNNAVLVIYNNLLKNSLEQQNTAPLEEKNVSFRQLDLLIKSNGALDEKFKSTVAFKAPVVQQTELLMENLPQEKKEGDFWVQFYIPYFTNISINNLQQAFLYYMLSSVDDKGVQKWLKSHQKDLEKFYDVANQHLKSFRAQQKATVSGKEGLYSFWFYNDNSLNAIGNQINDQTYYGPWIFYYSNGEVMSEGLFTDQGKKTGNWRYYYPDGTLKKMETYQDGELANTSIHYHENGNASYEIPYKADKIDGLVKIYYPCGQLKEELTYQNDKRQGKGSVFYTTGQLMTSYTFADDELIDKYTNFYKNGQQKEIYNYVKNKRDGSYEHYHKNGQLSQKGQYKEGLMMDDWVGYHKNGVVEFKGKMLDGYRTGIWQTYNADKVLITEESYDQEGKPDGTSRYYTENGRPHYEYDFKDGLMLGYRYFDQDQRVISKTSDTKGNFHIKAFYPNGSLHFEGEYKKGKMNGPFTYYHHNGLKSSIMHLVDNNYEGQGEYFYESGQKKATTHYKDDMENGYYRSYYQNGQVKSEGWVVDGLAEQTWFFYLPDGTVTSKRYYLQGDQHGIEEDYDYKGQIRLHSQYDHGLTMAKIEYDTLGVAFISDSLNMGNGRYALHFMDKKPRFEVTLQCDEYVSDLKTYNKEGIAYVTTPIKNGEYNGQYQSLHANNAKRLEGEYRDNEQNGVWTWYNESGQVNTRKMYTDGKVDGERISYYENGQISSIITYKNGEQMGSSRYYAPDGTLQIEKMYDTYGFHSYRYLDKNKQLTPFQLVDNKKCEVKAYYPNGQLSVQENYKHGLLDSIQLKYYPTGQLQMKRIIRCGVDEGVQEEYYPNGQLSKLSPYRVNELHGEVVEYYVSGKLKSKTSYIFGNQEGWQEFFDANGKRISREYFRNDTLY